MPQIGPIEVPEDLWKELVKFEILEFARTLLEEIKDRDTSVDAVARERRFLQVTKAQFDDLEQRLTSLVGDQTNRQDPLFIQRSSEYRAIWQAAGALADPIAFNAMFDFERLKDIADKYIRQI